MNDATTTAKLAPYSLGLSTVATTKNGHPVTREGNGSAWVTRFICDQCGQHKEHVSTCSTGYGTTKTEEYICFDCCGLNDARDLAALPVGGKTCLYLTSPTGRPNDSVKGTLGNWCGTFKIDGLWLSVGSHNIAGVRYDGRFMYKGSTYSATQYGNNTQICHIRRLKA